MGVRFPGLLSYWFGNTETMFKQYVNNVCRERGYASDSVRQVNYDYGRSLTGSIDFHADEMYKKMLAKSVSGYNGVKSFATWAANTTCPESSGGAPRTPSRTPGRRITLTTLLSLASHYLAAGLSTLVGLNSASINFSARTSDIRFADLTHGQTASTAVFSNYHSAATYSNLPFAPSFGIYAAGAVPRAALTAR